MTRKIMRNMARVQLEKEGRKKLNKKLRHRITGEKASTFSIEWKEAYIRNLVESLQRQGKTVRIVKRGKANG